MSGVQQFLERAAVTLRVDLVTAEVLAAMHDAGIRPLVLKGPAFTRWLGLQDGQRPYGDTDLLIRQQDADAARGVLHELGFRYGAGEAAPEDHPGERWHWARDHAEVDLHASLIGMECPAEASWALLSRDAGTMEICGQQADVPNRAANALIAALHAAQHGRAEQRPLDDLSRALAREEQPTWTAAAELAREAGAEAAFALGLRLLPKGAVMAEALELGQSSTVAERLRASTPPPMALGIERLANTRGLGAKAKLLFREAFPGPAWMRVVDPAARGGRRRLWSAYARRWARIVTGAGPAVRAWYAARDRR